MNASFNYVSPSYFDALGIPVLEGSRLPEAHGENPIPVAVNLAFARSLFPDGNYLGRLFGIGMPGDIARAQYQVAAVVGNAKYRSVREVPPATFYVPLKHGIAPGSSINIYVRTSGAAAPLVPEVRAILNQLAPNTPFSIAETMSQEISSSLWKERLLAKLSAVLAVFALLITVIGIYAVFAYESRRRSREIGIRTALGADWTDNVRTLLRDVAVTVAYGAILGAALYAVAGVFVARDLYGITAWNPLAFCSAVIVLALASALTCLGPIREMTSTNPALILRSE